MNGSASASHKLSFRAVVQRSARQTKIAFALVASALGAREAARADIAIRGDITSGGGVAVVSNGATAKDLDLWKVGRFYGWSSCIFLKKDPQRNEEICGCLDRQLSSPGPLGVELSLENVQACAFLFI